MLQIVTFSTFAMMNTYPQHFEQKIGFDRIRHHISDLCISTMGKSMVEKINFTTRLETVQKMLDQVMEFVTLLTTGKNFPSQDYLDLRPQLKQAVTPGSFIEIDTLFNLKAVLSTLFEIHHFTHNLKAEDFPELISLVQSVSIPTHLLDRANEIIDEKGEIKNNASPALASIRSEIATLQRQVFRETKKAYDAAKKSGWVPENSEITIRNGRAVIPLNAADKRAIGGIIHDESASGQTVFVEAAISFEINNKIKKLEGEERREIIKILTHFTDLLRPHIPELSHATWFLGIIDFIRAKALFSIKTKAAAPIITSDTDMDWKQAIHPLLFLAHREQNKTVVPLDIKLTSENRILVISGPNAGGKSVCLKTNGLLQYMLQCGFPVPASPDSRFRLFKQIFIDIGDEQSLENDLSTYSSHLLNMKHFLKYANKNTLVLIDEFGTGTEPQLGGAIAEATLQEINRQKAYGVITTHYTNLKVLAERTSGLVNGAMLFDSKEMQPLYILQTGKPGSSFAFEIARKIGFPEHVLNLAKSKSGGKLVKFDEQLQQLEIDKISIEKKKQKLMSADEHLSHMVEKYTSLYEELEKSKKQIIKEAQKVAVNIIEESNKTIEKTIRDIKEAEADKEKTKLLRENLENTRKKLLVEAESLNPKSEKKPKTNKRKEKKPAAPSTTNPLKEPEIGDYVQIADTDIQGELMEFSGDTAILNVNEVKLKTSRKKLVVIDKPKMHKIKKHSGLSNIINELNQKVANFSMTIDLRGKRAEEAMYELSKYIDECLLLNIYEVDILHGKGSGILRDIIRDYLNTVPEINRFGDAPLEQGGGGITRVSFNR